MVNYFSHFDLDFNASLINIPRYFDSSHSTVLYRYVRERRFHIILFKISFEIVEQQS